jgi:hypothetical protein
LFFAFFYTYVLHALVGTLQLVSAHFHTKKSPLMLSMKRLVFAVSPS